MNTNNMKTILKQQVKSKDTSIIRKQHSVNEISPLGNRNVT